MKRLLFTVFFAFLISAASFGSDFKLGAGGALDFHGVYNMGVTSREGSYWRTIDNNNHFGLSLFFDATYAEVDFLFSYGMFSWQENTSANLYSGKEFTLEISLLGKYPFYLERFTLFPLLGISGKFYLGGEAPGASEAGNIDTGGLGFVGGIGADFPLTERLYLRSEFLYVIKLPFYPTDSEGNRPGHGPRINVGIGYTFF